MNRTRRTRNLILVCTLMLFGATGASAGTGGIRKSANAVPNEYIVVFRKDIPKGEVRGLSRRLAGEHGSVARKIWTEALKGFYARMSENEAEKLSRHPAVAFVEENASLSFAATMQTNVDPALCALPGAQNCATTTDNRLWHLDRIDQNSAVPSNTFSYCSTGSGVRIYIVDTGVHGDHSEFLKADGSSRVEIGYNATVDLITPIEVTDPWPANNPCGGWNAPAVGPMWSAEYDKEKDQLNRGHGTGVASLAAGKKNGIAKEATIVPVKVARCDGAKARYRQPDHDYVVGDVVFSGNGGAGTNSSPHSYWRAVTSGRSANVAAISWSGAFGSTRMDGPVLQWERYLQATESTYYTVQMLVEGLNWILTDPDRTAKSVVSLSTSKSLQDTEDADAMALATHSLLDNGIPVIAAATNEDGNACFRGPTAFSRGNPNGYADKVITVGGTMLVNDPERTGYLSSQPTVDGRWTCADPNNCTSGSNGGPCVTLFAPAHEITVAGNYGATSYRGRMVDVPGSTPIAVSNSGTSWSAPLVAGVVAGYLQSGTMTVDAIYDRLIADSEPLLSETNRHPFDGTTEITGTPNLILRAGSVHVTAQPQSTPAATTGSTVLSATSNPSTGVTYQWYQVNPNFDLTNKRGAASSTVMTGETSATLTIATPPNSSTGYWVRVTGCGAADSDIAVVVPAPGAPSNLVATASGTSVSLLWAAGSGAEKYQIERKVAGQGWTTAGTVDANVLAFDDTPSATGGMVIYRVRSAKGVSYLPANNLSLSAPSNNDIANVNSHTYENLVVAPAFTTFKAQMLIELRQAANALATAAGISTMPFTTPETQLSSLQGLPIQNEYLTDLMTKINSVRTNSLIGMAAATWSNTPDSNEIITRTFVEQLRAALQ
jgi:hypothetical protein